MIDYYTDAEMYSAKKQKKKTLIIYFIVLGVYIAASLAFLTYFWTLPYSGYRDTAHKISLIKWGHYSLTAIFVIFSFIYLGIPFKRARYYFRMLDDIKTGQKQKSESTFLQNDMSVTEVGNVDFHTMVVLEWSDKTQEYMRRNVLVDKEKPMPKLKNGDIIVYTTHANVLLSYGLKSEETVFETE